MITSVKENWTPLDHYVDTQDIDTEILKLYRTGFNAFLSLFSYYHHLIRDGINEFSQLSTLCFPFMPQFTATDTNLIQH